MIRFVCSNCRQTLEVGSQYAGQQARCTRCGQIGTVPPIPAAPAPPPPLVPRAAGPLLTRGPAAPSPTPNLTLQLTCSGCGQWLELDQSQAGQLIRCSACGRTMQAPGQAAQATVSLSEVEQSQRFQFLLWILAGGLLGILFGTSIGVGTAGDLGGLVRALIGIVLGTGVGAIFIGLWAFRLGSLQKIGGWLVAGALIGALLGASLLANDKSRPGAFLGALVGGLLGTAGGLLGAVIWRNLDTRK